MKKITILIITFLLILISCKSKLTNNNFDKKMSDKEINYIPYYLKVYEADSLYLVKDYNRSYTILDSLFRKFKPLNLEKYKEYETYISCAFVLNKKFNIKDSILQSIEKYGSNTRYFKYDSLMNLAYKNSRISDEEAFKATKIYRNKINFQLRDSIRIICEEDQRYRQKSNLSYEEIHKIDSINELKLTKIFSKYNYPSERIIEEFYIDSTDINLRFVFLHTREEFRMNFLLPKILNAIKKGESYPGLYTESYDRYLERTTDKQLYGSYRLTREKKVVELINEIKIDSIRKSIGLPSISYNKWRLKKKYGIVSYD